MTLKQFSLIRILLFLVIGLVVTTAVIINNFFLALSGILVGLVFLFLVRHRYKKVIIDERVGTISGLAGRITYQLSTLLLAGLSIFLIISSQNRGDFFTETLGVTFGYVAILNMALYAFLFHYFNKKYGGDN